MNHEQIIRAWKDSSYRSSLSDEELAQLPAHPAGEVLSEAELDSVTGGSSISANSVFFGNFGGGNCSPITVNRSGGYFNNIYNTGTFTFSPDCSNNSTNYNTTFNTYNTVNY